MNLYLMHLNVIRIEFYLSDIFVEIFIKFSEIGFFWWINFREIHLNWI